MGRLLDSARDAVTRAQCGWCTRLVPLAGSISGCERAERAIAAPAAIIGPARQAGRRTPTWKSRGKPRRQDRRWATAWSPRTRSPQTVIDLIAATTTRTGLKVYARLDESAYPDKIKITDAQLAAVQLSGDPFHPEWNYTIKPRRE